MTFTARLVRSSKILVPPALLGWALAVPVVALGTRAQPSAGALLLMAGCLGLGTWLGLALALIPASFIIKNEPVRAGFGAASLCALGVAAVAMGATFWPLQQLLRSSIPRDLAFTEQLAHGFALYGASLIGALAAFVFWMVREKKSLLDALRSYPLWIAAVAFGVARAVAAPSVRVVAPEREALLDSVLLAVLVICMLGTANGLPRKVLTGLGAAFLVAVAAVFATVSSRPAARAELFSAYPGPAAMLRSVRGFIDMDGDGFSAVLGGNDCDDYDPTIYPLAVDRVGDQIDQNCNGVLAQSPEPPVPVRALSQAASPRSIVLITTDTVRADFLDAQHMPRLSALSKSSALFTRAYASAPYTSGSILAMMAGHPPMSSDILWHDKLGTEPPLAMRLRDAGYDTTVVMYRWWGNTPGWGGYMGFAHPITLQDSNTDTYFAVSGPKVTAAALPEIARLTAQNKPFFLWIHYLDPHAEYVARKDTPFSGKGDMLSRYSQEVWSTDREVGRVVDALEAARFFDRGVLVVHSDHGELVEDGERIGHAFWLDEDVLRTVLMMRGADIPAGRYDTRVRLLDVPATLLALAAGLEAPMFGKSLLAVVHGEERDDRDVVVYSSYEGRSQSAIIEGSNKLVQDYLKGTSALYDLARDPRERTNLIEARAGDAARLRAKLATIWDTEINDAVVQRRALMMFGALCQNGDSVACAALKAAAAK